jgi:hypothetical protein
MLIPKRLHFAIFCGLFFCSTASAQDTHLAAVQENIPHPDSGGRLVPFTVAFTNLTQDTVRFTMGSYEGNSTRRWTRWQLTDSSHALGRLVSVQWIPQAPYDPDTILEFVVMPHSKSPDLRLSFLFLEIAEQDIPRDVGFSIDYTVHSGDTISYGTTICHGYAACTGPWLQFDGSPVTNTANPCDPSGGAVYFTGTSAQEKEPVYARTTATFSISGEYSDRFILPRDTVYPWNSSGNYNQLGFRGASKSPVHDTLHCIFSSCWGADTINAPIEAYSAYGYGSSHGLGQAPLNLVAPFLGRTEGRIMVKNYLDVPITVKDLAVIHNDTENFIAESPGVVGPKDTGYIRITFRDNNVLKDLNYQTRYTLLTGKVVTAEVGLPIPDSSFSLQLSGTIDVYSPNYFSLIPLIKHGVHPAGIIFRSDRKSFVTFFGNNDSMSEYFYTPYYDDPHFGIAVSGISLPGTVLPDTGAFSPNGFQTETTFTGDDDHNYLTQIHWPRGNDTVTMDVLAVGLNAPPFEAVASAPSRMPLRLWPNPASSVVHLDIDESAAAWISDPLGRILRKIDLTSGLSTLDVSTMRSGLYEVCIPSRGESLKLEIIR